MHGEIDNPMVNERLDPKPRADTDPWIEVECEVKVKFRMKVERQPKHDGTYLLPSDPYFSEYVWDDSHDAIIEKARAILEDGRGEYEVSYDE